MYSTTIRDQRRPVGKLAVGLILLAVGAAMFLDAIDIWEIGPFWSYWPLILIVIGGANAVDAIRRRQGDGSWYLLGIGVWMLFGSFNIFGLSYGEALPIAIVVVGLGNVLHAIIDVPAPKQENEHERQQ